MPVWDAGLGWKPPEADVRTPGGLEPAPAASTRARRLGRGDGAEGGAPGPRVRVVSRRGMSRNPATIPAVYTCRYGECLDCRPG